MTRSRHSATDQNLPPILPVGTAVVLRVATSGGDRENEHPAGTTGTIIAVPDSLTKATSMIEVEDGNGYRVRFAGGDEAMVDRDGLEVLRHYIASAGNPNADSISEEASHADDLYEYVIYRCVIGSRAYGLDHDASDTDRRGVYLPPAHLHWSLAGVPEQLENRATEECYWELEKFLKLALKANPNVLEVLYSPLVETATPLGTQLIDMRDVFLSKLVYQTYNGYAMSQFKKLGQDLRNRGKIKWKHAMHLIRLLLAGIRVLTKGTVIVPVEEAHRDRLMAIRHGAMTWDQIDTWRTKLHRDFEHANKRTHLPDRPDYQTANRYLIQARKQMVSK